MSPAPKAPRGRTLLSQEFNFDVTRGAAECWCWALRLLAPLFHHKWSPKTDSGSLCWAWSSQKDPNKLIRVYMERINRWTVLTISGRSTECGKHGTSKWITKLAPTLYQDDHWANGAEPTLDDGRQPCTWLNTNDKAPTEHRMSGTDLITPWIQRNIEPTKHMDASHRPCRQDDSHGPNTRMTGSDLTPGWQAPTKHQDKRHRPCRLDVLRERGNDPILEWPNSNEPKDTTPRLRKTLIRMNTKTRNQRFLVTVQMMPMRIHLVVGGEASGNRTRELDEVAGS